MKLLNASTLSGLKLDYAVAVTEGGFNIVKNPMGFNLSASQSGYWIWGKEGNDSFYRLIGHDYSPSSDHQIGGMLAEKHCISRVSLPNNKGWLANGLNAAGDSVEATGETSLIAAMRCYLMMVVGSEIEIRDTLL